MIRLIWDFRGEDGLKTAEHHCIHLKEFAERHTLVNANAGVQVEGPVASAYLDVPKDKMILVRDALAPHRGEEVDE